MRWGALGLAGSLLVGGCFSSTEPVCPTDDGELVEGVACAVPAQVAGWIEQLSARPLTDTQRERLMGALAARARDDRAAFDAGMARVTQAREALEAAPRGFKGAQARARASFEAHRGGGPLPKADWPTVDSVRGASVAVWSAVDDDQLVLTEMDIEGWIRFASLCREAQGATPLKLSVGDRVPAYHEIVARFEQAPTDDRLGVILLGGSWRWLASRWQSASYDSQQAWIHAAPLPPPMTGTSRDYLRAVTKTSPAAHAGAIEQALGPVPGVLP